MAPEIETIESILNLGSAMENLDGDAELLQEVLEIFLEIMPEQLDALETSITAGNASELSSIAHSLKGSASNFCADKFVATALRLEQIGKAGSVEGAAELMLQLRGEFQDIQGVRALIDWNEILRQWSS
jgi:two-component system, sensor histidine kinase and response regulator